jgi:hypothetical protein
MMSRHTEIQNQYKDFVAAQEAAANINPGTVEVVYQEGKSESLDSYFVYKPEYDVIELIPVRYGQSIRISAKDIPGLIKALRAFFE